MLTFLEKVLFILLASISLTAAVSGFRRVARLVGSGQGQPAWSLIARRGVTVLVRLVTFQPVFRTRFLVSLFHAVLGWGFLLYLPVNLFDLLEAFGVVWETPTLLENTGRFLIDLFSGAIVLVMLFFVTRRFVFRAATLTARPETHLSEETRRSIGRDSAIVAAFILLHVGARLFGQAFALAHLRLTSEAGQSLATQPLANLIGSLLLLAHPSPVWLLMARKVCFWISWESLLLFVPYFPISKHLHLLAAPLNLLLKPPRRSPGEMGFVNMDDPALDRLGAETLADLGWEQLLDAYACIMCFRCQEACPAYQTGKILSPAVLEINKRYSLNRARRRESLAAIRLTEQIIPDEAIWACTTCGACVAICPVGNEPMRDILDIRRARTLMAGAFPASLEIAFRNLERSDNPWGMPPHERLRWAEGLAVPTIQQKPDAELVWWVGCAAAFDPRAGRVARAFAQILLTTGISFAVLGEHERCTADWARRAGREDLFFAHAQANVAMLNALAPKRIVTTCPHCLHVLKNEYPSFGGHYSVSHHTQLIAELLKEKKITLARPAQDSVTFHDPCYLARQNGIIDAPRRALREAGLRLVEMPRHGQQTFCCGAGGAQMWKEEAPGREPMRAARLTEVQATHADALLVACPFCLTMLGESTDPDTPKVRDLAEAIAELLETPPISG